MSCVRNWCGLVAGSLVLLNAVTSFAEELPNYSCEPSGVEVRYISLEDLRRLRSLRQEGTPSAVFMGLEKEDAPIVDEALRVGPSGGFYAARLLRDLVLIDAFERQSQCGQGQACRKPEIIAGFSVDNERTPGKTWQTLIADWKEFRNKDASRSRICLDAARKLPTFDMPLVAMKAPESGGQVSSGARQQAPPSTIPGPEVVAVEPKRTEQGYDDIACHKQALSLLANKQIYFSSGKSWVKVEDREFLVDFAGTIASCKSLRIALVGHTDSDGPRKYNQRLSRIRAEAVAGILRTTASTGIKISAFGETRPSRPNTSRANKAYNRRVTIEVLEVP